MHLVSCKSDISIFHHTSNLCLLLAARSSTTITFDSGTAESPTPALKDGTVGWMGKFGDYHLGLSGDFIVWSLFIGWLAVTELAWFNLVLH